MKKIILSEKELKKKYLYRSIIPRNISSQKPAIFFDRDGVLIKDCHYISSADNVEIEVDARKIIKFAKANDWIIIIITNQSGISRGYFNWDQYKSVTDRFLTDLGLPQYIDGIYANGFDDTRYSYWRKPNPGMIFEAQRDFNIDLSKSILIGDRLSDIQAGVKANIQSIFHVLTGHGLSERSKIVQKFSDDIYIETDKIKKLSFNEKGKSSKIYLINNLNCFPTNFLKLKDD
tara:strand:+ start:1283 stop:1978 length:696 start_codon:yes stop_codon:yes gene_type:complete